jgi:hypothetical protein
MDCREDQPVKTSTNRLGRITILTLSKPLEAIGLRHSGRSRETGGRVDDRN